MDQTCVPHVVSQDLAYRHGYVIVCAHVRSARCLFRSWRTALNMKVGVCNSCTDASARNACCKCKKFFALHGRHLHSNAQALIATRKPFSRILVEPQWLHMKITTFRIIFCSPPVNDPNRSRNYEAFMHLI